jgi:hypothetical protein
VSGRNRSHDRLRDELGVLGQELSQLRTRVRTLRQRTEQLAALRGEESQLEARMTAVERVLAFDRVCAHVREAVERAPRAANPVPHLVVADLLPHDAYRALIEALPAPVFFDGRVPEGQRLGVPPRLAPAPAIVTWMFLSDVIQMLSELLVTRFTEPLQAYARERFPSAPPLPEWDREVTLIDGRIVRRTPGYAGTLAPDRPWAFLVGVLDLARDHDGEEYGGRLADVFLPFRANTARVCVGPAARQTYAAIPSDASGNVERYTYEFTIGPTRQARQRLETQRQAV